MAPPKVMMKQTRMQGNIVNAVRKGVTTRSQHQNSLPFGVLNKQNILVKETRAKRKAEASPLKEKTAKRTAFANITNVSTCDIIKYYYIYYHTLFFFIFIIYSFLYLFIFIFDYIFYNFYFTIFLLYVLKIF